MDIEAIRRGLLSYKSAKMRQNIYELCGITVIEDCYNASPESMRSAIDVMHELSAQKGGARTVALLGDMLELGEESVVEHIQIVRKALVSGIDLVCFVGGEFAKAVDEVRAEGDSCDSLLCFTTSQELADWLAANPITDTAVLIKGSRGTKMEKVITVL